MRIKHIWGLVFLLINNLQPYAAFTHAGLTTRYRTESL